jgi:class 3 adenylate cyclase
MGLTEEDLATRAGTTVGRLRELIAFGIIRPGPSAREPFTEGDALRVQLVEHLASSGIAPATVAAAIERGALSLSFLDNLPGPAPRVDRTHAELCDEVGIPFELLDRIYVGFGLPRPRPDELVRADDWEIISGLPILFAAGLSEAEILRAARVWGEGPRRVAEHQVRAFHERLEEPYRRQGLSDDQVLGRALSEVGVQVTLFCRRLNGWIYGRHFETYATYHRMEHVEVALETAELHRRAAPHPDAAVFADLSGYTALTERLGDRVAVDIALGLGELMQDIAERHGGRVVKLLGDGVQFIFNEPAKAVLGSLDFVDSVEPRGLPPAHIGINAGPITYTDGDYYGLAVIIAARIASTAGPGEVLVGESVAHAHAPEGVRFEEIGPVQLKGVRSPVIISRAVREGAVAGTGKPDLSS